MPFKNAALELRCDKSVFVTRKRISVSKDKVVRYGNHIEYARKLERQTDKHNMYVYFSARNGTSHA